MNIIERIRLWRETRRRAREYQEFKRGYGWAVAEYYIDGVPLERLKIYAETSDCFDESPMNRAYDSGIEEAVAMIEATIDDRAGTYPA